MTGPHASDLDDRLRQVELGMAEMRGQLRHTPTPGQIVARTEAATENAWGVFFCGRSLVPQTNR